MVPLVTRRLDRDWLGGDVYRTPPGDPGLFGPDSVTWRVFADLPSVAVGGLSGSLVGSLHPLPTLGTLAHTDLSDSVNRAARTFSFLYLTIYGPTDVARRTLAGVDAIHKRVYGTVPDGRVYRADDPELVTWTHVTVMGGILKGYRRYCPSRLSRSERDRYWQETAVIAEGLGAMEIPRTCDEASDYLEGMRPQLAVTEATKYLVRLVTRPEIPTTPPLPTGTLFAPFAEPAIGLMPGWARALLGIGVPSVFETSVVRPARSPSTPRCASPSAARCPREKPAPAPRRPHPPKRHSRRAPRRSPARRHVVTRESMSYVLRTLGVMGSADMGRRYRLYPDSPTAARLAGWIHTCRWVWNTALEQRQMVWKTWGKTLRAAEQCSYLTAARCDIDWLRDLPAQSGQQVLRHLDAAYDNWLTTRSHGRPTFKKRSSHVSISFPGQAVRVRRVSRRWAEVRLPKLGWVRFRFTRPLDGDVRNATISHDGLGWHVSFGVASGAMPTTPNGKPGCGVDFGVACSAFISDEDVPRLMRPSLTAGEHAAPAGP